MHVDTFNVFHSLCGMIVYIGIKDPLLADILDFNIKVSVHFKAQYM